MMDIINEHGLMLLTVLLALSEALALVPVVKANSVFQLIVNILKTLKGLVSKPSVK